MGDGVLGDRSSPETEAFVSDECRWRRIVSFSTRRISLSASFYAGRESAPAPWLVRLPLPMHNRS